VGFGSTDRIPLLAAFVPGGDVVNTYIYYLLLYGIVGLVLFLMLLLWCLLTLVVRVRGWRGSNQVMAAALLAAFVGQLAIMLEVSPVGIGAQYLWVLLGLVGSLYWTTAHAEA
jgi:O-antigen ligase